MAFDALLIRQQDDERTVRVESLTDDALPEGDVLVDVAYSSLNYKDGLAVTGKGKIIRAPYPFVPGIDLAGTVAASDHASFAEGDVVVQTGWQLGEQSWGGFAQRQRLLGEHLVRLPDGMTPRQAMTIGTAGFTAMLSVMALEEHGIEPGQGEVVVTGASGGVGSLAVLLLSRLGFDVVASTGSADAHDYLSALGATRIIDRDELGQGPQRALDSARWAGAVDAVGGATLAAVISQLDRHGCVAASGNAGGFDVPTTVFPFILRGVVLAGIDSNTCPNERREVAWGRLAALLKPEDYERITDRVIGLAEIPDASEELLGGGVRGRIVVDVNR